MHRDKYKSFDELQDNEKENVDYAVTVRKTDSNIAVIAPHAGLIESKTSEVALAIADDDLCLYIFEGKKHWANFAELHVTSENFNDPACIRLISACDYVISIHGCGGDLEFVLLGGLDLKTRDYLADLITKTGIEAKTEGHKFLGTQTSNICNRGKTKLGVQIEISKGLRHSANLAKLIDSIRIGLRNL